MELFFLYIKASLDLDMHCCKKELEGRAYMEDLGVDGRMILKLLLQKLYSRRWSVGEFISREFGIC
jgi:hypothetical protein